MAEPGIKMWIAIRAMDLESKAVVWDIARYAQAKRLADLQVFNKYLSTCFQWEGRMEWESRLPLPKLGGPGGWQTLEDPCLLGWSK